MADRHGRRADPLGGTVEEVKGDHYFVDDPTDELCRIVEDAV
ncbi:MULTISPECIES: hypothetical protein [unclassified Streptomyces]|nr:MULTISPECIES: hypothetical protein [unclassified Streptomyces]